MTSAEGANGEQPHPARRVGVMGGTFDPIHLGHLIAASEVCSHFALDEVIFVPAREPWQKSDREIAAAEDRYQMTVLATAADPRFSVSRVELDRPGRSYTSDTLRQLHAELATASGTPAELFFIVGADALAGVAGWHEADKLPSLAHFVGVTRPGHALGLPTTSPAGSVSLLEIPALAITSTQCRERVGLNQPIWYLVPAETIDYIATRRLYRGQP